MLKSLIPNPFILIKTLKPPNEGILTNSVSASEPPSTLLMVKKSAAAIEAVQSRLAAFYELGAALGTAEAVEPLLENGRGAPL